VFLASDKRREGGGGHVPAVKLSERLTG